jgi:hypothetical protein
MVLVTSFLALQLAGGSSLRGWAVVVLALLAAVVIGSGLCVFLFLRAALHGIRRSDSVRRAERRPAEASRWLAGFVGTAGLIIAAWLGQQPFGIQAIFALIAAAFFAGLVGAAIAILRIPKEL